MHWCTAVFPATGCPFEDLGNSFREWTKTRVQDDYSMNRRKGVRESNTASAFVHEPPFLTIPS